MHEGAPFEFHSCQNGYCFVMPLELVLQMSIINFLHTAPIMGCSVCEIEERKSKINTYRGSVVVEGSYE